MFIMAGVKPLGAWSLNDSHRAQTQICPQGSQNKVPVRVWLQLEKRHKQTTTPSKTGTIVMGAGRRGHKSAFGLLFKWRQQAEIIGALNYRTQASPHTTDMSPGALYVSSRMSLRRPGCTSWSRDSVWHKTGESMSRVTLTAEEWGSAGRLRELH